MTAHRRIARFAATAAAGASILVGLTGCHFPWEDAGAAARTAGHHLPEIHESIAGALNDIKDATDGPVGNAVIGTACDAYAKGESPAWESDTLANLLGDTQPPEEQLLNDVKNLVATFTYDEQNGITTMQKIGGVCQVYLLKDSLT
jgi:hypothetical protein